MSGDVFSHIAGTEGVQRYKYGRVNVRNTVEKVCSYSGECEADRAVDEDLCSICKHQIKFDIPTIIKKELEKKNGS